MPDPAGLREIEAKDLVLGTVHLGFLHSFALPIPDGLRKEDLAATLRWGGFAASWDDPLAHEFQVAERFLLPPGQSRADFRQELDSFELVIHTTNPARDREIT